MANARVLVVDDDRKVVDLVTLYLRRDGYRVLAAYDGAQALEIAREKHPDLIILDLMLPGTDGLAVCRRLRAEGQTVPIIMLTARSLEEDKLVGLDLGADDYVTKPFSPRELVARVRAVLRRAGEGKEDGPSEIRRGDLVVDMVRHEVRVRGMPVHLTPREFRLLATLAGQPGRAFTRQQLLDEAFGFDYEGLERTVDVHIMNLRRKVEEDAARPARILTVQGVGYKFAEDTDAP
ncbi:MAG: response regulator transcription factor [Anaerolineae bacterium]|nr:response regulator transcription factor [Anaerolineae bacterium]